MSRIAKNSINLPEDVSCIFDNNILTIKGKQGEIALNINEKFTIKNENNEIYVLPIIDNYHMEFSWLEGFTYLLRGKTYDILGQRSEAKSDYKNVLEMDYFYKEVKEAEIYLESAFSLSR